MMQLLCRAAQPIKVTSCNRGGGEDQSDGSDAEDGESTQAPIKKKKKSPQGSTFGGATSTQESRAAGVQALLEMHASKAASGEVCDESMASAPKNWSVQSESTESTGLLLQEVHAHLALEPQSAKDWPVIFPSVG